MENEQFVCYICLNRLNSLKDAITHLKSHYDPNDTNLLLSCMKTQTSSELHCTIGCRTFNSLKCHMRSNRCILLCKDVEVDQGKEREDTEEIEFDFNLLNLGENAEIEQNCPPVSSDTTQNSSLSDDGECVQKFQFVVQEFVDKLAKFNLCHDVVDEILNFSKELVSKTNEINQHIMRANPNQEELVLTSTDNFVLSHIDSFSTRYKRDLYFRRNQYYVAAEMVQIDSTNIHANLHYVPIIKTLTALFKSEHFKKAYFEYNNNHTCVDGIYERFCCGKVFEKNKLFQSEKNLIQLQFYFDDFELCSPLKTKSRKVTALYCTIMNFSPTFVSQMQNMYLVALCDAKVVSEYGCNIILERLVNDVKCLETQGISIGNNVFLKGTIAQISFDNLGGNHLFGFTRGFNATYFCRICSCPKEMCQKMSRECKENVRTIEQYNAIIEKFNLRSCNNGKIDLKSSFGLENYCKLNDLNHFHSINNRSQDIMHDIDEGAIPFILGHLFDYLSTEKIITLDEIKSKIKSFDYGILERKTIPSEIFFKKKNLNQNASQMRCLIKHIPFIFVDLLKLTDVIKNKKVHKVWKVVEYMLKIIQVINSSKIKEEDLINVEDYIFEFLESIKNLFHTHLIPKLHFMTHYAETIRQMGPIVKLQTIRGEAKHQTFTRYGKRTNNFMNICKSLSEKHQQHMASYMSANLYSDQTTTNKKNVKLSVNTNLIVDFEEYTQLFSDFFENMNEIFIKHHLIVNSFYFKKGIFVIFSDNFYQIEAILSHKQSFIFFCSHWRVVRFHKFANSIEIRKSTNPHILLEFNKIEIKKSYEGKVLNGKTHIIADNLDLKSTYAHLID